MSAKLTASDAKRRTGLLYQRTLKFTGACVATAASRRRGRAHGDDDVSVFFSEAEVDDSTLTAATNALKAEGISVEVNDVDPIAELSTIEGVDSSTLETFKAQATSAVATMPPSPPPPPVSSPPPLPPPPPPPNLIKDDDDNVPTAHGLIILLTDRPNLSVVICMVKHDDYMTPFSAWEDVSAYIPRHHPLEAFTATARLVPT